MNLKANKMNRLVKFFIVLLLGLTSCGMQKQMSQDVQADIKTETHDSVFLAKEIESMVKATVEEILSKELEFDITEERRVWSPPDTLGEQYLVMEEKVTTNATVKESRHQTNTSVEESIEQIDSTSVSASEEDLVVETSTEVTEKRGLPWWQKTLMYIGAAVLIIIAIKIALKFI